MANDVVFQKGGSNLFDQIPSGSEGDEHWLHQAETVRKHMNDVMSARNVAFLLGSGCSSRLVDGHELGIPTMAPMARQVLAEADGPSLEPERSRLRESVGLDLTESDFTCNLERLLEVLYSYRFALNRSQQADLRAAACSAEGLIAKIVGQIVELCSTGAFAEDETVLSTYESFYRKLIYRDRALPRPWIFTTNYDLFNERAMDRQAIPYCNGFAGSIERRFNPALFRYSLAEQIDVSSRKWTAVDSFVYLCKLHGSINWVQEGEGLFPIRELQAPSTAEGAEVMIFPTPAKQNQSLGAPYSDLFREFHSRVVRDQSVLVTLGYGFGDEHVNNLIFQALTIPTFRLVSFVSPDSSGIVEKLRELDDPRIWLIGGRGPGGRCAHHFDVFVDDFMPEPPSDEIEHAVEAVVHELISPPFGAEVHEESDDRG
ncbi:MAG: SIR2 family protein [bacterium]|nr:SIR2 family protein [bacterium]